LRGLLLGDSLGTVKVVLHGNYSKGCRENGRVRVGKKDGIVLVWGSIASPGEGVQRLRDPPVIGTRRRDGQLGGHNTEKSGGSEGKTTEHGRVLLCRECGNVKREGTVKTNDKTASRKRARLKI